ncbi:YsnF/AvaK domain-containing protein [Hymenobacter sp. YC55]|uniref:YsnF/AvaK domain-containing protein n=1 Tax=Hymenobacter sp. YC55 TaxID=3034019 RepID=UPI0023F72386|nr:YsnF/AvaK domain-containing protein [Hymenobacter sp. YC55]MDF7812082.1 YsnF/AvaK domain-containing protein [Hymenobacter sp. YC55]
MDTSTNPLSADASDRLPDTPLTTPLVVPVIEEHAVVHREVVESGRVRLSKTVQEHEEAIDLALQHEEVNVERVPLNQYVADEAAAPAVRYEGDTLVIPVVREVVVKRLLLVEELRVTKHRVETHETQNVTLRSEQVHVERIAPDNTTSSLPNSPNQTL